MGRVKVKSGKDDTSEEERLSVQKKRGKNREEYRKMNAKKKLGNEKNVKEKHVNKRYWPKIRKQAALAKELNFLEKQKGYEKKKGEKRQESTKGKA